MGVELDDGGFLFGGWNGVVVRIDKYGDFYWINCYRYVWINDVVLLGNIFYLVSGTLSGDSGFIAIDLNGDFLWIIKFGGTVVLVVVVLDGGVVFGGNKNDYVYIVKVSSVGVMLWGY